MARVSRFLLASVCFFVLSWTVLQVCARAGLLAGVPLYTLELPIRWSVPYAIAIGCVAGLAPKRLPVWAVLALGTAFGFAASYLSARLSVLHYAGIWKWGLVELDYELQMAFLWAAAAISALLIAVGPRWRIAIPTSVAICALAIVLPGSIFNQLTHNQQLTVVFAVPSNAYPADVESKAIGSSSERLDLGGVTDRTLGLLRSAGIPGEYRVSNVYQIGTGKPSLQVIVVNEPASGTAHLPQPNATEVVYVQHGGDWQRIPANAPVLDRSVEIWKTSADGALAGFAIPDARGISLGGGVPPREWH